MNSEDIEIEIATRHIWGRDHPVLLQRGDRRHHLYAVGKTGTGKSTFLRNILVQLIHAGESVALIDPHGDLATDLLDRVPRWRTNDVVYVNPADQDHPVALNLLRSTSPETRHLVVSSIVGCFKSIWKDSWGPRLDFLLSVSISALLEVENTTILGLPRLLTDGSYREWVLGQIHDPVVRSFFTKEWPGYDKRFIGEMISPVLNKVQALLIAAPLRHMLGQVKNRIDLRHVMDDRRIFIANLSKGLLGEDKANLLGAVLVSQFHQAAMSRADTPEDQREDFTLVIDEFHSFLTDSFASIFSECRKYRTSLIVSNQFTTQLPQDIRDAVFGNVGTLAAFRVGHADADLLSHQFGGSYPPAAFSDLSNYEVIMRKLQHGEPTDPFRAKTLAPLGTRRGRREQIIRRSRQRYATPRRVVEDKLNRWIGT